MRSAFAASFEERGMVLEELLAREADDEDRARPLVGEVLDELEERRLGPVDVVEDEDERLARARSPRRSWRKSQAISGAGGGVSASRAARTRRAPRSPPLRARASRSGQYVMPSP